jgi:hypothetical protein
MRVLVDEMFHNAKEATGRRAFLGLLEQYLKENNDSMTERRGANSDIYLGMGHSFSPQKILQSGDIPKVVRCDGLGAENYYYMLHYFDTGEKHKDVDGILLSLDSLTKVDRIIYQSVFCKNMFEGLNKNLLKVDNEIIYNGVKISTSNKSKNSTFIIYSPGTVSGWYRKLYQGVSDCIKDWCEKNKFVCVEVNKISHVGRYRHRNRSNKCNIGFKSGSLWTHDRLIRLFQSSKYMIHLYPNAPCSNAVLEAMNEGTIVFSFNNGGDPELNLTDLLIPLTDNVFDFAPRGVTVSNDIVCSMVNKVEHNYNYYVKLTKRRIQQFDYMIMGDKYKKAFEEVLSGKKRVQKL